MVGNDVNFSLVQDERSHPREQDWLTKHLLCSDGGKRIGSVPPCQACKEDASEGLPVGSDSVVEVR